MILYGSLSRDLGVPIGWREGGLRGKMELNNTLGRFPLVGDHHFVVEVQVPRLEQMKLQRTFLLALDSLTDEEKMITIRK